MTLSNKGEKILLTVNGLVYKFIIDDSIKDDFGHTTNGEYPIQPWSDKLLKAFEVQDWLPPPRVTVALSLDTYYKFKQTLFFWVQEEVRNANF